MLPPTNEIQPVPLAAAVTAAQDQAVVVERSQLGMLKFTGETRLDLIHRMSTQDVNSLQPGTGTATILTTDIGRIIDRLILYASAQEVYALTGENNADNIARYLMRFVFFNDDFYIEDLSATTRIWGVYGREAQSYLQDIFSEDLDLPLHHWRRWESPGDRPVYIMRTDPVAGDGYFVMSEGDDFGPELVAGGLTPIDDDAFDYLRIASGRPRFGQELTGDYIPLEAHLWADVSFSKGCYIGQEIIARMESRGQIAKQLVQFQATERVPAGETIQAGEKKAGTVTSIAEGSLGILGLGYIKTALLTQARAGDIELTAAHARLRIHEEPSLPE